MLCARGRAYVLRMWLLACVHACMLCLCVTSCKKIKLGAHEMVRLRIKSDDEGTQVLEFTSWAHSSTASERCYCELKYLRALCSRMQIGWISTQKRNTKWNENEINRVVHELGLLCCKTTCICFRYIIYTYIYICIYIYMLQITCAFVSDTNTFASCCTHTCMCCMHKKESILPLENILSSAYVCLCAHTQNLQDQPSHAHTLKTISLQTLKDTHTHGHTHTHTHTHTHDFAADSGG